MLDPLRRNPRDLTEPPHRLLRSMIFMDLSGESPIGAWATLIAGSSEDRSQRAERNPDLMEGS